MNVYALVLAGMGFSLLIASSIVLFYLRYQQRLAQEQLKMREADIRHQKDLLGATILSQEEERKRIGMDLHDQVGSALSSLRMILESIGTGGLTPPEQQSFKKCKPVIDKVITDVRNISHNLSPFTKGIYGLADALEDLCDNINRSGKLHIALNTSAYESCPLGNENLPLALYRVLAELINNTVKHAGAAVATIDFEVKNAMLFIKYTDDGIGMPAHPGKKGMGMQNMESRLGIINGSFTILPQKASGLEVLIEVPLS